MILKKTSATIDFSELAIGNPFFYLGKFWIRTGIYTGSELMSSGNRLGSVCGFTNEVVNVVEAEDADN